MCFALFAGSMRGLLDSGFDYSHSLRFVGFCEVG